jgi:CubicO group peptidase (beta-lactamase class C family)
MNSVGNVKPFHISCIFLCFAFLAGCGGGKNTSSNSSSSSSLSSANSISSIASSQSLSSASSSISANATLNTAFDTEIKAMMQKTGATAVTVAVAKNGQIEYEQAYGFQDSAKTILLKPNALMRTASIIKPVTAAAVRKLARDGKLALSDHAFCTGSNAPCWLDVNLLSSTSDARVKDITVEHLVTHKGGWYRDVSEDPIGIEPKIRDSLSLAGAPTRIDDVRYVMALALDYTPGKPDTIHDNYSNFGYMVLSLIIEQASKDNYTHYVQTEIMAQLGIASSEFKAGKSKLIDHDPREPVYISTTMCDSVFTKGKTALCSEEGANADNLVSVGMTITTARTMALFAQAYTLPDVSDDVLTTYNLSGEPLAKGATHNGAHDGVLPGTTTFVRQLPSGISYAIFTNTLVDGNEFYSAIQRLDTLAN